MKKNISPAIDTKPPINSTTFYDRFKDQTIWHLVILVFLPFFVFIKVVNFLFIDMDDVAIITNNYDIIGNLKNIGIAFKTDAFVSAHGDYYRPIQTVTFMIDAFIGGEKPWIYHLSNLIYHLLTVVSLYFFLRSLKIVNMAALCAALLFSVHPLLSSAVSWIPARGDVLIGLWGILLFMTFDNYLNTKKTIYFILHALLFMLAAFTKEVFVVFPVLFLLYYLLILQQKFDIKNLIPFFVVWIIVFTCFFIMRSKVVTETPPSFIFGIKPLINNLPTIPIVLAKFFIPAKLSTMPLFEHTFTLVGILILGLLIFFVVKFSKAKKWLALMGFAWFIFFMMPPLLFKLYYSNFLLEYYEHRTYLAIIGLIIFIAFLLNNQLAKGNRKSILYVPLVFCIFFIPVASIHADDFKDSISFFTNAAENNNPGALTKRGESYYGQRDFNNAQADFNQAILMSDNLYPPAFFNRGKINAEVIKNHTAAEQDYTQAVTLDSTYIDAYINRSGERIFLQNFQGAYDDVNKAKALDNKNAKVYFTQGSIDINTKNYKNAIENFSTAIKLDSFYAEAYNNRGFALYNLHEYKTALNDYTKAIELYPVYLNAYYNKGMVYYELNQPDSAIKRYDSAIMLADNFYFAFFYRGMAKQRKNDIEGACKDWHESVKLGFNMAQDTIKKYCK